MAVAYYTEAALQCPRQRRSPEAKQSDGDRLVRGLADRLGGTVKTEDTYSLSGREVYFMVAYWSPPLYRKPDAPPAVGAMRSRPLHHWDLHAGADRKHAARDLARKVGEATLALASRSGGVALDESGFPVKSPGDLLPR